VRDKVQDPDDFEPRDELDDDGGIEVDFEGVETEDDLEKSQLVTPGRYHAVVDAVTDHVSKDQNPDGSYNKSYKFVFQIRAGEDPDMAGKFVVDYLGKGFTSRGKQRVYAKRLGLVDESVFGTKPRIDFKNAAGAQCVIEVFTEKNKKTGRDQSKLTYSGVYDVWDPRVADVPKDASRLPPRPGGQPAPAATPRPPAPAPQAGSPGTGNGPAGKARKQAGKGKSPAAQDWSDLA
jgi:hypothetical protein